MFAVATRNFVEEVDRGGFLIPVSSPNDALAALSVVVRRKRFWFWQQPKYQITDFILSDILAGDTPVQPVLVETDFVKYSGTFGDNIQGTVDASFVNSGVNLEGKDSSKLQSSFGNLKKEEVDVQKLLRDCKDKVLDMSHSLIQQTKDKNRRALGVVKERIVTTQPCSVIEEVQRGGQCGASLTPCGPKTPKVTLKENGSLSKDSNVTMEIPSNTTIAYGLIELEIRHDGRFEFCVTSDTAGGFEVDGPVKKELHRVSGAPVPPSQHSSIQEEMSRLSDQFQLLSALPVATSSSLLQQITKLMQDRAAVGALQHALGQMSLDKSPDLGDLEITESQRQNIKAVLDLLERSGPVGRASAGQSSSAWTAIHIMSSALDELTSDSLAVLGTCCSPQVLQSLEQLVRRVSGSGETPLSGAALTQDAFEKARHLFAASNVSLKKDGDVMRTEISPRPGHLPLVLCIAVTCLASLARGAK